MVRKHQADTFTRIYYFLLIFSVSQLTMIIILLTKSVNERVDHVSAIGFCISIWGLSCSIHDNFDNKHEMGNRKNHAMLVFD